MNKLFIPLILGTGRVGRESEKVARFVFAEMQKSSNLESQFIDVRDYAQMFTVPPWQESQDTKRWKDIAARADAFMIVTPEYNHGYPGELKMLLDQEFKAYAHKPVALCTVSDGYFGGARAAEQLLPVVKDVGLVHTGTMYFPKVKELFDENGQIKDESYGERIAKTMNVLTVYAEALRGVREALK